MIKPHINVPYDVLENYLPFIKQEKSNLEIYFGSRQFSNIKKNDIIKLKNKLVITKNMACGHKSTAAAYAI